MQKYYVRNTIECMRRYVMNTLNNDTINWLLEEDTPSVRCDTLIRLFNRSNGELEVKEARDAVMRVGIVPDILDKMSTDEYAVTLPRFYRNKYEGLVWQLIILAELSADGKNEKIKKHCEYILEHSQEKENGGFSVDPSAKGGGRKGYVIPCLTGNMIFSLIRLGFLEDIKVQRAVNWVARFQRYDDGDSAPEGDFYERYEMCWGRHSCFMGVIKALKAFSEIPEDKRDGDVKASIERGTEYMLRHHIYKKSHDLSRDSKPGWKNFSFPLMYQTDVLEILLILARLGIKDRRMDEAIELVESKRGKDGRWRAAAQSLRGKFLVGIDKEQRDKWVTLRALEVLDWYGAI
jgi:hypothetical protein